MSVHFIDYILYPLSRSTVCVRGRGGGVALRYHHCDQSDQTIRKKICQIFQRIAQKVAKSKKGKNIYDKAQFENPKHLH
jgi:hypothetical protein